jgi:hypothetical protein
LFLVFIDDGRILYTIKPFFLIRGKKQEKKNSTKQALETDENKEFLRPSKYAWKING